MPCSAEAHRSAMFDGDVYISQTKTSTIVRRAKWARGEIRLLPYCTWYCVLGVFTLYPVKISSRPRRGQTAPRRTSLTTMRQTRALLFALVAWLQAVHCRELTERNTPPSKDVQHEIKVHGVPSVQLTPQEIKDAFHEPTVIMDELKRLKDLGLTEAVQAVVEGTAKLAAGHKATGDIIDAHYDNFAVAMRGYTFLEISDSQRPENVRYRKALFVAACASLSAAAQARAASMPA